MRSYRNRQNIVQNAVYFQETERWKDQNNFYEKCWNSFLAFPADANPQPVSRWETTGLIPMRARQMRKLPSLGWTLEYHWGASGTPLLSHFITHFFLIITQEDDFSYLISWIDPNWYHSAIHQGHLQTTARSAVIAFYLKFKSQQSSAHTPILTSWLKSNFAKSETVLDVAEVYLGTLWDWAEDAWILSLT